MPAVVGVGEDLLRTGVGSAVSSAADRIIDHFTGGSDNSQKYVYRGRPLVVVR